MPYLAHFALTAHPFGLTPNTEQYFPTANNSHILQSLQYATRERGGILKVSGDVGTGKTMLCRLLLRGLMEDARTAGGVAYLNAPQADGEWLLAALCMEYGLDAKGNRAELMHRLNAFLLDAHAEGRTCAVVVDEAQALGAEGLETIRLLSNLETEQAKLLQIVLFGQPELDDLLARPDLRQINQRIVFAFRTQPLSQAEVSAYVQHRLHCVRVPGVAFPIFTPGALDLVARASGGVPRVVNILADKALLIAYGAGAMPVTEDFVEQAIADSQGICQPLPPRKGRGATTGGRPWLRRLLWGTVGLEVAALIAILALNPDLPARAWGMMRSLAGAEVSAAPTDASAPAAGTETATPVAAAEPAPPNHAEAPAPGPEDVTPVAVAEPAVPPVAPPVAPEPSAAAPDAVLETIEAETAATVGPRVTPAPPEPAPSALPAKIVPQAERVDSPAAATGPRPVAKPEPPPGPVPTVDGGGESSVARITKDGRWSWE